MSTNTTIEQLSELRLRGVMEAYEEQLKNPQYRELTFEDRFAMLIDRESLKRKNSAFQRRVRLATLRYYVSIEEIDYTKKRTLNKRQVLELAQSSWIVNHLNLIITGPTGIGKTFIASALGFNACKHGFTAKYVKLGELLSDLMIARHDGTSLKVVRELQKVELLIIDEWLREPMSQAHANELLDLIDSRFRQASTVFISQLEVKDWHPAIVNPALSDAILDRIVHDGIRMELDGDSMRKSTSLLHQDTSNSSENENRQGGGALPNTPSTTFPQVVSLPPPLRSPPPVAREAPSNECRTSATRGTTTTGKSSERREKRKARRSAPTKRIKARRP